MLIVAACSILHDCYRFREVTFGMRDPAGFTGKSWRHRSVFETEPTLRAAHPITYLVRGLDANLTSTRESNDRNN